MDTVVVVCFVISLIVVATRVDAVLLDGPCTTDTDCTVQNSECTGGKCSCDTGYYSYNNISCSSNLKGGVGPGQDRETDDVDRVLEIETAGEEDQGVLPGRTCTTGNNNNNKEPCVDGAVCQLPRTLYRGQNYNPQSQTMYMGYNIYGVCLCQVGYYSTAKACEPRIALGGSCIYYGTVDKDVSDEQCQEHAACITHLNASKTLTYVCECVDKYYVPKYGVCVKEIPLGGICTHNGENECVTPNADCYAKEGKSTCQCSDEYRQDGHSSCVSGDTAVTPSKSQPDVIMDVTILTHNAMALKINTYLQRIVKRKSHVHYIDLPMFRTKDGNAAKSMYKDELSGLHFNDVGRKSLLWQALTTNSREAEKPENRLLI